MYRRLLRTSLLVVAVAGAISAVVPVAVSAQVAPPATVFAVDIGKCPDGQVHPKDYNGKEDTASCCPRAKGGETTGALCFYTKYINPMINFLAALIGIVVVGSVIAGGIQYSSSSGDSGKAAAAKKRIINSLVALAAFVFLWAFLQWIVPGGFRG